MDLAFQRKLLDVSRQMAENRALDPLLIYAMDIALELFNAERGYLVLVNRDGTLNFRVRRDHNGRDIQQPEGQISTSIFHKVVTEREPIVTARAMDDPKIDPSYSIDILKLRSVMCVPLIARNHVIGALYLENRSQDAIFVKKDLEPLQFFASQAAVSIENALLNEELERLSRKRAEELRVINEMLQHKALEQGVIDRKTLQEALERERARMIANFIQDASHHFRTPLSIINTNVDIVDRKMGENPYDNYFNGIRKQVNVIVELVDTLNYMVNLDSVAIEHVTTIDLNSIVREMHQVKLPMAKNKNIDIQIIKETPNSIRVRGNVEFVRQALGRLLDNAIAFTPEEGLIKLRAYATEKYHIIEVDDDGVGISPEDMRHIFQRFFRSDKAGTTRGFGLGLSIALRIMELHDGHIDCQSEVGKGSIFRMIFQKD